MISLVTLPTELALFTHTAGLKDAVEELLQIPRGFSSPLRDNDSKIQLSTYAEVAGAYKAIKSLVERKTTNINVYPTPLDMGAAH